MQSLNKTARVLLATLLTIVVSGNLASAHGDDPYAKDATKNGWETSLAAAVKKAQQSGKPVMVVLRCVD